MLLRNTQNQKIAKCKLALSLGKPMFLFMFEKYEPYELYKLGAVGFIINNNRRFNCYSTNNQGNVSVKEALNDDIFNEISNLIKNRAT